MMKAKVNKVSIQILQDKIAALPVAAFVRVTDPNLSITPEFARQAGEEVIRTCREIGWCKVGSAVITPAGQLPFEKIIHAVGPRWGEGNERGNLVSVTHQCLHLAEQHQLKSVALPAISTGTLGYPLEGCARVMLRQIVDFTFEDLRFLRSIVICLDNALALDVFNVEFGRLIHNLQTSGEGKVKV